MMTVHWINERFLFDSFMMNSLRSYWGENGPFNREPGISKSWFQWYMMYRICNNIDIGPNYAGCHKPPKVVV